MIVINEPIIPPVIENTVMYKMLVDEVHRVTIIAPSENYILHDNNLDDIVYDEITMMPTSDISLGYKEGEVSVRYDYNFAENPRELYTVLRSDVPEGRIF